MCVCVCVCVCVCARACVFVYAVYIKCIFLSIMIDHNVMQNKVAIII